MILASVWVGLTYYHGKIFAEKLNTFLGEMNKQSSIQFSLGPIKNYIIFSESQLKVRYPKYHLEVPFELRIIHGPINLVKGKTFIGFGSVLAKMHQGIQPFIRLEAKEHVDLELVSTLFYNHSVDTRLISEPKRILYRGEYYSAMSRFEPVDIYFNWEGLSGLIEHSPDWNIHVLDNMRLQFNRQYSHAQKAYMSLDEVLVKSVIYRGKEISIAVSVKNYKDRSGLAIPYMDVDINYSLDTPNKIQVDLDAQVITFPKSDGVKVLLNSILYMPKLSFNRDENNYYLVDNFFKMIFDNLLNVEVKYLSISRQDETLLAKGSLQLDHFKYLSSNFINFMNCLTLSLDVSIPTSMEKNMTWMLNGVMNSYKYENARQMSSKQQDDFSKIIYNTLRDKRVTHQKGQFDFKFKLDKGTFDLVG